MPNAPSAGEKAILNRVLNMLRTAYDRSEVFPSDKAWQHHLRVARNELNRIIKEPPAVKADPPHEVLLAARSLLDSVRLETAVFGAKTGHLVSDYALHLDEVLKKYEPDRVRYESDGP